MYNVSDSEYLLFYLHFRAWPDIFIADYNYIKL